MRKMRKTGSMTALAVVLALGACSTVEDSWDYVFSDDSAPDVATPAQGPAADGTAEAGAAAVQAPVPEGLRGDPQPPDYGPGTRRQPTSTRSLVDEPASAPQRSMVESVSPAASPAPSAAVVQKAELAPPPAVPAPGPDGTIQAPSTVPVAPPPAAVVAPAPVVAPLPAPVQARTLPLPAAPTQPVMPLVPTTPAGEVYASQPLAGDVAPPVVDTLVEPQLRLPPAPSQVQSAAVPSELLLVSPPGGAGAMSVGVDDLGTTVIGGDGRVLSAPDAPLAHPMLTPESHGFDMADQTLPIMMRGAETLVATIQFGRGSSSLSANERGLLRQVVQIQRQSGGVLQVVGHASSQTADMSMDRHMLVNYTTSARRAEAVAAELRRLGAPREAVVVVAQSDNAPIYREIMPSGEAGNRRAEIYLVN